MITKFTGDGLFFTSDTHFNHANILRFCNRPWESIEEHDQALIENWNSVIGPDDTVFHLGDFVFGGFPKWKEIVEQLNGHIYLIRGNHDDKQMTAGIQTLFEDCLYQARILVDGKTVYLNHFPFLCFGHGDPKIYKDSYSIQLFGHIHSGPNSTSADVSRSSILYPTQYDVGVDNNNYCPISWKEVNEKIQKQLKNDK
jgi:calcineurin-like phosphoesterase family protein